MKNIYAFLNNCNPYNSIFQQTMLLKERLEHIYGIKIPVLNRKGLMMHLNRENDLILLPYDSLKLELISPLTRFNNVVFIYHNITPAHFFWKTEPLVAMRAIAGRLQLRYLKYVTKKWIAVSEYNKKELEHIGFHHVTLCSNLIKCSMVSGEKTSEPSLLYVGRIVQNKRCLELLNIAKSIAEKLGRPISLYIVGNGKPGTSYLNKFTHKIQQLSSNQLNIHWLKGLTEEELSEMYSRCWIYITLSQHEGFGLPVCESINNGTPAIYTSCGGQECVLNNIGLVNESYIAEEAASLLTDRTKLESLYTQQKKLVEHFTIPNYDKELERIFNKFI